MIVRLQEQGYNTAVRFSSQALQYVTNLVMQTAIKVSKVFFLTKALIITKMRAPN